MPNQKLLAITSIMLFLLASAATAVAFQDGRPVSQERRPRPFLHDRFERPLKVGSEVASSGPEAIEAPQIDAWMDVVFQSFRDGNWEIYILREANALSRLTYNGHSDSRPRLNRGSNGIVFVSDRHGNPEIYTMDVYGGSVKRLTHHPETEFNPAWSRDGNKIAYQSYRGGQSEIYVMNADGSDQTRLTNNTAYDGMPSWSPDGSKIVFASSRGGVDRIWVMDSDGGNKQRLNDQKWSENPVWSPDGSQIAYDSDGDNDGWQELWLMNADGSNQREIRDAGGNKDLWLRAWSPDGEWLSFTQADWTYYRGQWYWTSAKIRRYRIANRYEVGFSMNNTTADAFPDWQTGDVIPPQMQMEPLSPYAKDRVVLKWTTTDPGGSGIREYEIQIRDGEEGDWTTWLKRSDPSQTSATFIGVSGHTFYYRIKGIDNAYNEQEWTGGDGQTQVTFYDWAISGTADDNRSAPLQGAAVTGDNTLLESLPSDGSGRYEAYFVGNSLSFEAGWAGEGYGSLPPTQFAGDADAEMDVLVPPADNILADWDFEHGALDDGYWQTQGSPIPTAGSDFMHTGDLGAFVGMPFSLTAPIRLQTGGSVPEAPLVAPDDSGTLHAIWRNVVPGAVRVMYAGSPDGDVWSTPAQLSDDASNVRDMLWAVAGDGRIHVVWIDRGSTFSDIYHVWRDPDGTWSDPQFLVRDAVLRIKRLVVAADGSGHLLWEIYGTDHDGAFYSYVSPTGQFQAAVPAISYDEWDTDDVAIGPDGRVHLLLRYSGDDIYYTYRTAGGVWSPPEHVFPGGYNWILYLFVDQMGTAHVIWANVSSDRTYHRQRSAAGEWSPISELKGGTEPDGHTLVANVRPDGTAIAAWQSRPGSSCPKAYYVRMEPAGEWSSPIQAVSDDLCVQRTWLLDNGNEAVVLAWGYTAGVKHFCYVRPLPSIRPAATCFDNVFPNVYPDVYRPAVTTPGIVHFVWQGTTSGTYGVHYARAAEATDNSLSAVVQQLTIPLTLSNPTLSFAYAAAGGLPGSGPRIETGVDDGLQTTIVYSGTSLTGWTFGWADMSPWLGETITLTLGARQAAGTPRMWANLDEVAIGSAHPDLWLSAAASPPDGEGLPATLEIYYGNRGGVAAEGGLLTVTLPAELDYVSAAPSPLSTGGAIVWNLPGIPAGSGPFSIIVSTTVNSQAAGLDYLEGQATISASGPELALANNQISWLMSLKHFLYVPVLLR